MSLGTIDPFWCSEITVPLGTAVRCAQHSLLQGLPDQWSIGTHSVDHLLDRRARHLRVALVVQQRFVRRSVDYSADAL